MHQAKKGDIVKIHFTGRLQDGTRFASTAGETPLELRIGDAKLIEGFEYSIVGMSEGMKKMVQLEPPAAFGERRSELVKKIPRHEISEKHEELKVGGTVWIKNKDGRPARATVTKLSDQEVTLDANHPLAGETLTFDIELVAFA